MMRHVEKQVVMKRPWFTFARGLALWLFLVSYDQALTIAYPSDSGISAPTVTQQAEWRIAPHEGFENDEQFQASVNTRVESIVTEAGATSDALDRGRRFLAAANLILSDAIEPSCTRRLLGLGTKGHGRQSDDASWLDRADVLIEQAKGILDTVDYGGHADEVTTARRHLAALDAFSKAMRVYLDSGDDQPAAAQMREVASGLSSFLEDKNAGLAASATLWQSALLAREGVSDRVLAILDLPLSDLPRDSLPYSFHARLLRCRALCARGAFSTAYALLLQMEELTTSWMSSREQAEGAMRTIALTKWQVLEAWYDRLDAPEDREEREWCRTRMAEIEKELVKSDVSVIRLYPAMPRLLGN